MIRYTHVFVKGDAWTPERFWEYIFLKEEDVKNFPRKDGYIRKINRKDYDNLKHCMEKKHANCN